LSKKTTDAIYQQGQSKLDSLDKAVNDAKEEIAEAANQRVTEVKQQVTPQFDEMLKEDFDKLQELDRNLTKLNERGVLLASSFRLMDTPDKDIRHKLAAAFNTTVTMVHVVLVGLLLLLILNVVLIIRNWNPPRPLSDKV
jgi:hypothetical protein